MNRDATRRILFVILLLVVLLSAYRVIAPFLAGLTWAMVLVATFRPLHDRLQRAFGGRERAAAAAVTLLVAAFVAVPLLVAAVAALHGGIAAIQWIATSYQDGASALALRDRWPWIGEAIERAKAMTGLTIDLRATAISALQALGSLIADKGPALVGGALGLAFSFGVMLFAMPMLFANGERLTQALVESLPIAVADGRRIIEDLPAAIWLAAVGHPWKAAALVAWGAGVVSTIDNVLRPIFAGRGAKLPGRRRRPSHPAAGSLTTAQSQNSQPIVTVTPTSLFRLLEAGGRLS